MSLDPTFAAVPSLSLDDTIAAIATPIGEGGLSVIRISGPKALEVADRCFRPAGGSKPSLKNAFTHSIHYGHVVCNGRPIDEVLAAVMLAPKTFTREDVVEFSCHGGLLVVKLVLDAVLESGARLAEPGEFTKRAFLNGRIDLTQAEAVADLIHARTELSLAAANEQLAGRLSSRVNRLRDDLMHVLAHLEAHIDFPDEDIAPEAKEKLVLRLEDGLRAMEDLLRTARDGEILRRGIRVAIVGRPNAGKSSLLNQVLGHDRAIVSAVPGTTRDTIEETVSIRGLPVVFIDTAGLREAHDLIEQEGIRRSHAAMERAEIILHVLDNSEPFALEDAQYLSRFAEKPRILVRNKCDLPPRLVMAEDTERSAVHFSALTGHGLAELKEAIRSLVWSGETPMDILSVAINARHQDALRRAEEATRRGLDALEQSFSLEFVAVDLRTAANAVGEIVGKTTTENLLDLVFSSFCIGK